MMRELEKLEYNLGGVANMERLPDAVVIIDLKTEEIALNEASRLDIPIIGLVDTNCDPSPVYYVIPGNDAAIRSCDLIIGTLGEAIEPGASAWRARTRSAVPRTSAATPGGAEKAQARGRGGEARGGGGRQGRGRRQAEQAKRAERGRGCRREGRWPSPPRRTGPTARAGPARSRGAIDGHAVTAADVKALRDRTGAGMMDCKQALEESGGDVEKAIEILRKKGAASAGKAERARYGGGPDRLLHSRDRQEGRARRGPVRD